MKTIGHLDTPFETRCQICGVKIIQVPDVEKTIEADAAAVITISTGCGECGENQEAMSRSAFMKERIAEIGQNQLNQLRIQGLVDE